MIEPLACHQLRWRCDSAKLKFETTAEVTPIPGVIGQPGALEALRFGLECDAHGQNVFIRGLTGTGRLTMVRRLLEELQPTCRSSNDLCYVHNFTTPDRPRLISLPPGKAREFRRRVNALGEFVREGLPDALSSAGIKARRDALERRAKEEIERLTKPFEESLRENGLALVSLQMGPVAQTAIFPIVDGKPVPPEEFEHLHETGRVTDAQHDRFLKAHEAFRASLAELTENVRRTRRSHHIQVQSIIEEAARAILGDMARQIIVDFPGEEVATFLSEIVDDVAENHLGESPGDDEDFTEYYGVNILLEHDGSGSCPIIIENAPTLFNLLGTVDREWGPRGAGRSDYTMISGGSLLRADGGFLIMEARDVLTEPGAWKVLVRTLRSGKLEIVPPEMVFPAWGHTLKPDAIPVNLKVVLLGDSEIYYLLDTYDPDFPHLFKVLADFDPEIIRDDKGVTQYAGVLARIARDENLLPFHRDAVAALAEHGARIAARTGKLTSRFGRVADIAREASFLARKAGGECITAGHVKEAVQRTKARGSLPSSRFRELVADGTIRVETHGTCVGQINGLAVAHAGPLTYGFPARITATIGAGSAGVINIEREAALSGAIHTKGFYILGGLMRHLLQTDHPLAFSASIAFEQSYGGIDGDSASGAEICCLLSALTALPIRQDLAMTGAIDQHGHILAIGAVNEKIEGFYDACMDVGLTGSQGVLIPSSNAGDLMLREDVVAACRDGRFHVYAIGTVHEALELLTGMPAGVRDADGNYPVDSVLGIAVAKAYDFWQQRAAAGSEESPEAAPAEEEGEEEESPERED